MSRQVKKMAAPYKPTAEFLINFYDASLRQETNTAIASLLGITVDTLVRRLEASNAMQTAKTLAEARRGNGATLANYVYKRLSPEAQKTWDEVQFWHDSSSSYERIEQILGGKTTRLRQELFIHALVCNSFDVSSACYVTATSRARLNQWKQDVEFRLLVEEIQTHKANFFEKALIDLVVDKNPSAIIFANKTINANRGYSEKVTIEHTGAIGIGLIDLDKLNLPLETRKVILEAMKVYEASQPVDVQIEQNLIGTGET